jgi:hypothetical protein
VFVVVDPTLALALPHSPAGQPSSLNPTAYPLLPNALPHSALAHRLPSPSPRAAALYSRSVAPRQLPALARSLSSPRLAAGVRCRGLLSSAAPNAEPPTRCLLLTAPRSGSVLLLLLCADPASFSVDPASSSLDARPPWIQPSRVRRGRRSRRSRRSSRSAFSSCSPPRPRPRPHSPTATACSHLCRAGPYRQLRYVSAADVSDIRENKEKSDTPSIRIRGVSDTYPYPIRIRYAIRCFLDVSG